MKSEGANLRELFEENKKEFGLSLLFSFILALAIAYIAGQKPVVTFEYVMLLVAGTFVANTFILMFWITMNIARQAQGIFQGYNYLERIVGENKEFKDRIKDIFETEKMRIYQRPLVEYVAQAIGFSDSKSFIRVKISFQKYGDLIENFVSNSKCESADFLSSFMPEWYVDKGCRIESDIDLGQDFLNNYLGGTNHDKVSRHFFINNIQEDDLRKQISDTNYIKKCPLVKNKFLYKDPDSGGDQEDIAKTLFHILSSDIMSNVKNNDPNNAVDFVLVDNILMLIYAQSSQTLHLSWQKDLIDSAKNFLAYSNPI